MASWHVRAVMRRRHEHDEIDGAILQVVASFMGNDGQPARIKLATIAELAGVHYNTADKRTKALAEAGRLLVSKEGRLLSYAIPFDAEPERGRNEFESGGSAPDAGSHAAPPPDSDDLRRHVGRLETKVERLETKVERLESQVDRLEGQVNRLEQKLDELAGLVSELHAIVTSSSHDRHMTFTPSSHEVHTTFTSPSHEVHTTFTPPQRDDVTHKRREEEKKGRREEEKRGRGGHPSPPATAISPEKQRLAEMVNALSDATGMSGHLNWDKLSPFATELIRLDYTPEQVVRHYGPTSENGCWNWRQHDWRGVKGEFPTLEHIRQTISGAVVWQPPAVSANGSGSHAGNGHPTPTDPLAARRAQLLQEVAT